MGFMDKAKKMAEQAQAKLDDAQKQFNSGQQQGQDAGPVVEYDKHGRPIASQAPPSAPPHGDPLAGLPGPAAARHARRAAHGPEPPVEASAPAAPRRRAAGRARRPSPAARARRRAPPAGAGPVPHAAPARPESDAPDEDRNHPSYAPPKLSSGDPLAG